LEGLQEVGVSIGCHRWGERPREPLQFKVHNGSRGHSPHQAILFWARSSGSPAWSNTGEKSNSDLPAQDADIVPDGVTWWQVKFCGEDDNGNQSTPFSNVISFGPVPA
jgi:hypothetical protein